MKRKKELSGLKRKKVLIIIILAILVLCVAGAVIAALVLNDEEPEQNAYNKRVEQILNLSTEPYSEDDEEYESEEKEEIQYKIKVNKKNNVIVIYKKDKSGKYSEEFKSMTCSVGRDVPVGKYKTSDRYTWKIVNGNVWAQFATRLDGAIMFQSAPYSEKSKDTLIPRYYNQLGSSCNALAIRLTVADAKWIMENSPAGTSVEVFEDDDIGPLGKPKIPAIENDDTWDPTDPDPANPNNGYEITLEGIEDRTVERGIAIDYLKDVRVVNDAGIEVSIDIQVDSDIDIFKCGTYDVKYTVRDASGKDIEKTVSFKVVDTLKPVFSGVPSQIAVTDRVPLETEKLLKGIYVIDNNQFLPSDRIKVSIPDNIEDGDMITFSVTDDYGNETSIGVVCKVDTTPPEIQLVGGIANIISIDQVVDEDFAINRVIATDSGNELSREHISVDIVTNEWGYTFNYTVTDDSGLTAQLQNTVTYPTYTIEVPEEELVDDLTDISLLRDVVLIDSLGNTHTVENVKVTSAITADDKYLVNYEYEYTSPLGTKVAKAERFVILNVIDENEPEDIPATEAPEDDNEEEIESEE